METLDVVTASGFSLLQENGGLIGRPYGPQARATQTLAPRMRVLQLSRKDYPVNSRYSCVIKLKVHKA